MKSWQRIILVSFVLIGGTMSFGYWSVHEFNNAFDNLSASYIASPYAVNPSFRQNEKIASTSLEISGAISTSTEENSLATTATTTLATTSEPIFAFPEKGSKVYIGCTYPVSWQSPTMIKLLGIALVDAGTRELMGPIASGLARETTIKNDSTVLNWKVGGIWPGKYYLKISKINEVDVEIRSHVFTIGEIPKNTNVAGQEKFCKEAGGTL
jgi:hypothetical protein